MSANNQHGVLDSSRVQVVWSQMEQRAIKLLGSNTPVTAVAQACGVDHSRISQLMSRKEFADEVGALRFQNLQKHNELDDKYDKMELKVATMLEQNLELMMRPGDQLKALQLLNGMKRRGVGSTDQVGAQSTVVTLLMPVAITQKFTTNVNNQVIVANGQTLETIQGSSLLEAAKAKQGLHNERKDYVAITEVGSTDTNRAVTGVSAHTAPETISSASLKSASARVIDVNEL